jgi:hypothetical protein
MAFGRSDAQLLEATEVVLDGVVVRVRVERSAFFAKNQLYVDDEAVVTVSHHGCGAMVAHVRAGSYFFALGRQDLRLGHAAFDDRYLVKADELAALRYWLSEVEADAMLASYEPTSLVPWELTVTPTEIRLKRTERLAVERGSSTGYVLLDALPKGASSVDVDALDLTMWARLITDTDRAVRTAAILAHRGERLATAWRERLTPLGLTDAEPVWSTDERYGATLACGRARIRVDFPWSMPPLPAGRLRTRLAIEWPHDGTAAVWPTSWRRRDRPEIDDDEPREVDGWRAAAAGTDVLATLPDLGAALTAAGVEWLVATPRRLAIGWEQIVDDPERLTAACALLRRWVETTSVASPYR